MSLKRKSRPAEPNWLLASLPAAEYRRLQPCLHAVTFAQGDVVCEQDAIVRYLYFPRTTVFSVSKVMRDGSATEVGTIGAEGFAGLPVLLGMKSSASRCLAQIAGTAARLDVHAFGAAIGDSTRLRTVMRHYAQSFINQITQAVACNSLHSLRQRFARWLLMMQDRGGGDTRVTQQDLADVLGVSRESVSSVARELRDDGAIDYRRGRVTIVDRRRLERAACECYSAMRAEQVRRLR